MASNNNKSGVSEQILSLPKGGGAIKGMGEKFQPDLHTGTGNFSLPLTLPPGRNDFAPQLALAHSTGAGNSPFGLGWSLSTPLISRKTSKGIPRYDDALDTFILAGAEDLVEVSRESDGTRQKTRYRPRTEGLFARIMHVVDSASGEDFWEVTTRDGVTSTYGQDEDSQIFFVEHGVKKIFAWYLTSSQDSRGNKIIYHYERDDGPVPHEPNHTYNQIYLSQIKYCNYLDPATQAEQYLFRVDFDYGEFDADEEKTQEWQLRPDPFSAYRSGFEIRTARRCRRILIRSLHPEANAPSHLIRSYDLYYAQDPLSAVSLLQQVVHRGYATSKPGPEARNWDFEAQTDVPAHLHRHTNLYVSSFPPVTFSYSQFNPDRQRIQAATFECDHPPEKALSDPNYELIDLYGNGLPDVLHTTPTGTVCWRNLGHGQFAAPRRLQQAPAGVTLAHEGVQLADMEGNGSADLLVTEGSARGFYENNFSGEWGRFHPYTQAPSFSLKDPNVRLVDLDGDGIIDVLGTFEHHFLYIKNCPNNGRLEFAQPLPIQRKHDLDEWPDVYFAQPQNRVRLADMSGDGLQDMVLIHDGRIDYWPNLGHGRWGKRITLLNGPHLPGRYDPERLFLTDINGDGLADLIYVDTCQVHYWINQSGNRWSAEQIIACGPPVTDADSIRIADINGTGTGDILWSYDWGPARQRNYRYFDFTGGEKPHLLTRIDNHMGAVTQVAYQPSTDFYVEDQRAGQPWQTPLPFPVNVVSQVLVEDKITGNILTTRYNYHHGLYEGREREFRGFGRVDQYDAEPLASAPSDLPPVLTKTWFHTGAYFEEKQHLDLFRSEYFQGDKDAFVANSSVETDDAPREAYRALSGAILRSEVYALDGSVEEPHPYTVTEHGYQVKLLQAKGAQQHAVFLRSSLESFTYHYERNPEDPRINQTITHEIDAYGNIKQSVAIAYPRRSPSGSALAIEQMQPHITHEAYEFINQDQPNQPYFIGVNYEARATELQIGSLPQTPLRPEDVTPLIQTTTPNLFSHVRNYFDGLPLGQIGNVGALTQTETLALKPQQRQNIYVNRVSPGDLQAAGYHEDPPGSDQWWVYTQRTGYDSTQYYQPVSQTDPLGNVTTIEYEGPFYLLPIKTVAAPNTALETVIEAENDYRTLTPYRLTDPNGNRTQVQLNALGMVVATAVLGKAGANEGDTLSGFLEDVAGDALTAPHPFLQGATSRLIVDLFNFEHQAQPNRIHTIVRETHQADLQVGQPTKVQHSLTYSDGFGREIQSKIQAEPGDVNGVYTEQRWVGSGWKIYNNKGLVVEEYEPFFSATPQFQDKAIHGVSSRMTYDPLGRVVRTDNPNGTFSRVEFDPWQQTGWDENDTVANSAWYQRMLTGTPAEQEAAAKAYEHRDTPSQTHLDTLGRTFLTIEDNGPFGRYETRTRFDIQGNVLEVIDPRGNSAFKQKYDLVQNALHRWQMDSGERFILLNAVGNPVKSWDSQQRRIETLYDVLNRPIELRVFQLDPITLADITERLVEKTVYGEGQPQPEARNLRGQVYQQYDGAGVETFERYDFKGNLLKSERRLLEHYQGDVNWEDNPGLLLDIFSATTSFDALDRVTASTIFNNGTIVGQTMPTYNEANLPESVQVSPRGAAAPTPMVKNIAYNAKGQREEIVYGNGAITDYKYDPDTFRLIGLQTTRPAIDDKVLQDYHYTFDPVGNITRLDDQASQAVYFRNQVAAPVHNYTYDPLYRLVSATGREHAMPAAAPRHQDPPRKTPIPDPNNPNQVRPYTQTYSYDAAGNIREMKHALGQPYTSDQWTQNYEYEATNNRLKKTSVGANLATEVRYHYDPHGNITAMASAGHLPGLTWDFEDQLQEVDLGGGGKAYYRYDAAGQRVRKVVVYQNGHVKERLYLGDYEIYREYSSEAALRNRDIKLERETLHVMDDEQRVAMIETLTIKNRADISHNPERRTRYQLSDHLGSAAVELNPQAKVITFEEYYPYGGTSYHSTQSTSEVNAKRYRYNGKEKDEETGLYYYGARYYAPWLGRWVNADPLGLLGGSNRYEYTNNNPLVYIDPGGTQPTRAEEQWRVNYQVEIDFEGNLRFGVPGSNQPQKTVPPTPSSDLEFKKSFFVGRPGENLGLSRRGKKKTEHNKLGAFFAPEPEMRTRKSDLPPEKIFKEGFRAANPDARFSPGEHTLDEPAGRGGSQRVSASTLRYGAPNIRGKRYRFEVRRAKRKGAVETSTKEILADLDRLKHEGRYPPSRIETNKNAVKNIEGEVTWQRARPDGLPEVHSSTIERPIMHTLRGLGRIFTYLAVLSTIHSLAEAASKGKSEFTRELVRQAGSWMLAIMAFLVITTLISGPWGIVLGFIGSAAAGNAGHQIFDPGPLKYSTGP